MGLWWQPDNLPLLAVLGLSTALTILAWRGTRPEPAPPAVPAPPPVNPASPHE